MADYGLTSFNFETNLSCKVNRSDLYCKKNCIIVSGISCCYIETPGASIKKGQLFDAFDFEVGLLVVCNQSLRTHITMPQYTIAGGRTKGANERSFLFVHQHDSYGLR